MLMKWRRGWMLLGAGGISLLLLWGGAVLFRGIQREFSPGSLAYAEGGYDDPLLQTFHNGYVIAGTIGTFASDRHQFPESYAELTQSPYMCIRSQDLVNPYSGQPVQQVSEPAAGDLTWNLNSEAGTLDVDLHFPEAGNLRPFPIRYNVQDDIEGVIGPGIDVPGDSAEKKLARSCWGLTFLFIGFYFQNFNEYPPDFSTLTYRFPILEKMWNGYQNRYAVHREWNDPLPGDLNYRTCTEDGTQYFELTFWYEGGEESNYNCSS